MTFKGYIRRVYVLHIESKIHTEPLIQYVCSSIKYLFTYPFFRSADCLLCSPLVERERRLLWSETAPRNQEDS